MPDILHRFTIDAAPERVHGLIATKEGVERWWNAHPNTGDDATLAVFFGGEDPAAIMRVVEDAPERIVWRVIDGPADWIDRASSAMRRSSGPSWTARCPSPARSFV